jgi:hypothetical protein
VSDADAQILRRMWEDIAGAVPDADAWDHLWGYYSHTRDGKVSYLRSYRDPDEALAAAGVDSP